MRHRDVDPKPGYSPASIDVFGEVDVKLTVVTALCGDKVTEGNEACDEGNVVT